MNPAIKEEWGLPALILGVVAALLATLGFSGASKSILLTSCFISFVILLGSFAPFILPPFDVDLGLSAVNWAIIARFAYIVIYVLLGILIAGGYTALLGLVDYNSD